MTDQNAVLAARDVNVVHPETAIYVSQIDDMINGSVSSSPVTEPSTVPAANVVEVLSSHSHVESTATETQTHVAVSASSGRPNRGQKWKHLEKVLKENKKEMVTSSIQQQRK